MLATALQKENMPGILWGVKSSLKTLEFPLVLYASKVTNEVTRLSSEETSHSGQGIENEDRYVSISDYLPFCRQLHDT